MPGTTRLASSPYQGRSIASRSSTPPAPATSSPLPGRASSIRARMLRARAARRERSQGILAAPVEAHSGDLLADVDALVEVGRRAPGSDAERRAARHLESRFGELGRKAESESIDVWPNWPLAYALFAAFSVVGSVLSVSIPIAGAILALAGALLLFLDAGVLLPTLRRLLGRRASQNVISWGEGDRPGLLLLVAHYDAGRGGLALSDEGQRAPRRARQAAAAALRRPRAAVLGAGARARLLPAAPARPRRARCSPCSSSSRPRL